MIQSGKNNLIVSIDTKWVRNFTDIMRNAQLDPNSKVNPADMVNIIGKVVSVPVTVSNQFDYKGFSTDGIQEGDVICFRYSVIFNFVKQRVKDTPIYKNLFWYKGKEYWTCNIQEAFFVIRDEKIIMLNGYCMIEEISKPVSIIIPQHMKRLINALQGTLTQVGENRLGLTSGDTVYFHPLKPQRYQIKGKEFSIIKQRDILGKVTV